MPVTRIEDVIVPEVFTPYMFQRTKELSAFVQSGIIQENQVLTNFLAGGGLTVTVPSTNDLANDDANISNDDPAVNSTPYKLTTTSEVAIRLSRNNSWSSMDLTGALAGIDPMKVIADRVAAYWVRQQQKAVIASLSGIVASNQANNGGDYVFDITGLAAAASLFSSAAFLDTVQTMGDAGGDLGAVACHSVVFRRMQLLNLIDMIPDARGEINIPTFLGHRVIVDDALVMDVAGENVFTTYLFANGSLQAGYGAPEVPTELDRKPSSGNGGGQSILHSRVEWAIHPVGHKYVGATDVGGPANAVLATAASWERSYNERKQVPIAVLHSKG